MARKRPRFRCEKCKKNMGSAALSFAHFQKHPSHRTDRQQKDYIANQNLRAKGARRLKVLPTIERKTRARTGRQKFCTDCGTRSMPAHNYCGGCGDKL